jgi:hypothetical protein
LLILKIILNKSIGRGFNPVVIEHTNLALAEKYNRFWLKPIKNKTIINGLKPIPIDF